MRIAKSSILGFPRIGANRELKKALEAYWEGSINAGELANESKKLRVLHWNIQKEKGLSIVSVNDFSYYDHVLDLTFAIGAFPERYLFLISEDALRLYFAMARGERGDSNSVTAMEMSKWFDTNYHYIVPELNRNMQFTLQDNLKVINEIEEARHVLGTHTELRPVLVGPITYLSLARITDKSKLTELLPKFLDVYVQLLQRIAETGVESIQIDEPILSTDINQELQVILHEAYDTIAEKVPSLKIFLATYFDDLYENASIVANLPVDTVHIDLVRGGESSIEVIAKAGKHISLGLVNGRNIWKANLVKLIAQAKRIIAQHDVNFYISSSCSLLHCPIDLVYDMVYDMGGETSLDAEIQSWLSFAVQKIEELVLITNALAGNEDEVALEMNARAIKNREESMKVHKQMVKQRVGDITPKMSQRISAFDVRIKKQQARLHLPLFPTTTIGSFPQTSDIRKTRAEYKNGEISYEAYSNAMKREIKRIVEFQEEVGLDVLVHGEPERNDMVEYFGENFEGVVSTKNGWVQSYGSRCVKPPIIFGDLTRKGAITVDWIKYAQSLTQKPMKGMLTGPVTILQWSFVRDDQPRKDTAFQIALLMRDEVQDLEAAGIGIIQVDEPAIREGLPMRKRDHNEYLRWAVEAFKISVSAVKDETQIHTHMCYSDFNEIITAIVALDADVVSIEASRSDMQLLDVLHEFNYPNGIGPGVYDIHSPRIPSTEEIVQLLVYARQYIKDELLWINPDCGLKTRSWEEVTPSLMHIVEAARRLRG